MFRSDIPVKRKARWLTIPATIAGPAGAVVASVYASAVLQFPKGTLPSFFKWVAFWVALTAVARDLYEQSQLTALRAWDTPNRELRPPLSEVVACLKSLTQKEFWSSLACWVVGGVGVGFFYCITSGAPFELAFRLSFIACTIGSTVAVLASLMVLQRARRILHLLSEHADDSNEFRRLFSTKFAMHKNTLIIAAILLGTPVVSVMDVSLQSAFRMMDQAVNKASMDAVASSSLTSLAVTALVILLVVACVVVGGGTIGDPLKLIANHAAEVAKGLTSHRAFIPAEDEIFAAADALVRLEADLNRALQQIKDTSAKVAIGTEQLALSSEHQAYGNTEQTAALTATSATTEELASSAKSIALAATDVAMTAHQTLEVAQEGKRNAEAFVASIVGISDANHAAADSVVKLNKRVQHVGRIVEFIDGIADKADLLALNAEVEGFKAGEVGRGFSLVAAEMRRLAESVMESTREIRRLIDDVRDATNAAVMATEAGVKATVAGNALAQQVSDQLANILEFTKLTSEAVRSITMATQQHQTGTDQLASAMVEILESTRTNSDASVSLVRSNNELIALAKLLKKTSAQMGAS